MGESVVFVAERFDRIVVGPQQVRRRHQEDMCQALGIRPSKMYEIGRPSKQMARLLREQATKPGAENERLFQQVAFRVIVGDEDGHGKNYSVCLDDGQVSLSPLYDCLCTPIYPNLSGKMGAPVGRQQSLSKVYRQALCEEALAMGILLEDAETILDNMTTGIEDALASLPVKVMDGWESDAVFNTIHHRIERLRADEPMGQRDRPTPPRQATLDELTR